MTRTRVVSIFGAVAALTIGVAVGRWLVPEPNPAAALEPGAATATAEPTAVPQPTPTPAPTATPEIVVQILDHEPPTFVAALAMAAGLATDLVEPSDCGIPIDVPASLPNSPREYRSGIHQGIDFICGETGRDAIASRGGRVVVAVDDYVDPDPLERSAILGTAGESATTPAYTLVMLYGNYVVLDHGVIPEVGHVITLYAHLESVDPNLTIGGWVEPGQRIGEIGNRGTDPGATGVHDPNSLHLHWELQVDDLYLGAGLDASETRTVYTRLFAGIGDDVTG